MVEQGLGMFLHVLLPLFMSVPKLAPLWDTIGCVSPKALLLSAGFPCGDKAQAPAHTTLGEMTGLRAEQRQPHQLLPAPSPSSGGWPKPLAGVGGRLQAPVVLGGNRRFCFECLQPGWEF